jgi:NAD(P)-dependent dehydrogenase (short-subunit alcohol dehydrogenase family)
MNGSHERKSALIIGASRGLGLGLSLELLRRGWNVTATVRAAIENSGLEAFPEQVTLDTLDINKTSMVTPFVERRTGMLFDVVFLNAGVMAPKGKTPENVTAEEVAHLMMTNAVSPIRLAGKLRPMVRPNTGILAFMSSRLGSVESNTSGMAPLYSASKAALNSLTRSLVASLGKPEITVISFHPGWVRTDMGGANADIDIETSVTGIASVLEAKAGTGGHTFLDYQGNTVPW